MGFEYCNGFIWLIIESSERLLWTWYWTLRWIEELLCTVWYYFSTVYVQKKSGE